MEFATHVGVSKVIETQLWAIDSKMQLLLVASAQSVIAQQHFIELQNHLQNKNTT